MKQRLSGFLSGVLTTVLVCSLTITALAASGQVSFNVSAIKFNGTQISTKGEDYTLPNGAKAPSSITYTDEKGGGTTYLPARRITELLGVEIGYDSSSQTVNINKSNTGNTPSEPARINSYPEYPGVPMFERYYEYEASASGLVMSLPRKNGYYYRSTLAKLDGEDYQNITLPELGYTLLDTVTTSIKDFNENPIIIKSYKLSTQTIYTSAFEVGQLERIFIVKIGSKITDYEIEYCQSHITVKGTEVLVVNDTVSPNGYVSMAMETVKERLIYPDDAKFDDGITIETMLNRNIVISGTVKAKNSIGNTIIYKFIYEHHYGSTQYTVNLQEQK